MTAPVFRAPMRSRDDSVDAAGAVERALRLGVCGLGGRVDGRPGGGTDDLAVVLAAVDARHGERMARRLERFAAAPLGAFVWTRDVDGLLRLGRLSGPWRYDDSADAARVDLVHVRACDWLAEPVDPRHVPPGVSHAFARGGRNWQRIRAADASPLTATIWDGARGAD